MRRRLMPAPSRVIACIPAIQAPRIAARSQPGCIGECMAQDDSEQNDLLGVLPVGIAAQWLPKLEPKLPGSVMKASSAFRYSWAETRRPEVPSYKALPRAATEIRSAAAGIQSGRARFAFFCSATRRRSLRKSRKRPSAIAVTASTRCAAGYRSASIGCGRVSSCVDGALKASRFRRSARSPAHRRSACARRKVPSCICSTLAHDAPGHRAA